MIGSMTATSRRQRCYENCLKELIRTTGDFSLAVELGIPRSTAIGWLRDSPKQVVSLDVLSLDEQDLQHEVLMLRRRIRTLRCLLRLLLTMLRLSEVDLANERVPGKAKATLLRAVE